MSEEINHSEETAETSVNVVEDIAEGIKDTFSDMTEDIISADPEPAAATEETNGKKKKRKRKQIYEYTAENDIKYRGPLSYRYLKVLGWAIIILGQISTMAILKSNIFENFDAGILTNESVMGIITALAVPLLLFANFAVLLNGHDRYKRLLIINGGIALAIFGLTLFIDLRYVQRLSNAFAIANKAYTEASGGTSIASIFTGEKGFLAFNIYIDLFLCTLIMYFVTYRPKKHFQGKKIAAFRALAVLPLLYEVICIMLKVLSTAKVLKLPLWVSPLLSTKPPLTFLMFISLVMFIKLRERKFIKNGKTYEDYRKFLKTNKNSLDFSTHAVALCIVYAIIDILIFFLIAFIYSTQTGMDFYIAATHATEWGFGQTAEMLPIIPILLLFSYTRTHKGALLDLVIAPASIVVLVLVYIDNFVDIAYRLITSGQL